MALKKTVRSSHGNMLILVAATSILIIALMLFALWMTSAQMGGTANRTAIESAALAAANSAGRIVVDSPECGFVSLTGYSPVGSSTKAPDNWYQQVRSINELMATSRVDLIIADQMGNSFLKTLAIADRDNCLKAKDELVTVLTAAIKPGGSGTDAEGNTVKPYDDALNIYLSNAAVKSSYIANSLKLTLGGIDGGIQTPVAIPHPADKAFVPANQQVGGKYRSDCNIGYKGTEFVFASISANPSLADSRKFATTVPGLAFQMPAAIKVQADQKFQDQQQQWTTSFSACATAGGYFRCPVAGAFTVNFPDGPLPELTKVNDMYTWPEMASQGDYLTALNGDFPVDSGSTLGPSTQPIPFPANPPTGVEMYEWCLYTWLRQAGSNIDVDSAVNMPAIKFNAPATPTLLWKTIGLVGALVNVGQVPSGIIHIFEFDKNGEVVYKSKPSQPAPYLIAAHNQFYGEIIDCTSAAKGWGPFTVVIDGQGSEQGGKDHTISSKKMWDVYFRSFVSQPGLRNGGKHGGEPMDSKTVYCPNGIFNLAWSDDYGAGGYGAGKASTNADGGGSGGGTPPIISQQTDFCLSTLDPLPVYGKYTPGPASGAPRPTYSANGICTEIKFRRQIDVTALGLSLGIGGIIPILGPVSNNTGYVGLML